MLLDAKKEFDARGGVPCGYWLIFDKEEFD